MSNTWCLVRLDINLNAWDFARQNSDFKGILFYPGLWDNSEPHVLGVVDDDLDRFFKILKEVGLFHIVLEIDGRPLAETRWAAPERTVGALLSVEDEDVARARQIVSNALDQLEHPERTPYTTRWSHYAGYETDEQRHQEPLTFPDFEHEIEENNRYRRAPIDADVMFTYMRAKSKQRTKGFQIIAERCQGVLQESKSMFVAVGHSGLNPVNAVASAFVEALLSTSEAVPSQLRKKIDNLAKTFLQTRDALRRDIAIYQVARFMQKAVGARMGQFKEALEKNKNMYIAYAKMFGGEPDAYQKALTAKVDETLKSVMAQCSAKSLDEGITKLTNLEAELAATGLAIASGSHDFGRQMLEKVTSQLEEIRHMPCVTGILFDHTKLVIAYKDVSILHAGKRYDFGPYEVCIPATFDMGGVEIHALNHVGCSHQHPHIISGGSSICWGTLRGGIQSLQAEMNLPMMITLIYEFLQFYNQHDKYVDIDVIAKEFEITPVEVKRGKTAE